MNFDLDRMTAVLQALGNPQASFPAIHVAGTNGKGSVSALLSAALRAAGYRTGLYTSPHLENLSERFQVDGREMSPTELARFSRRVFKAFRLVRLKPTQFEFLTAVAFLFFAARHVNVAVVEVGLGGRLDATNTLTHVAATVITNIGLDHMEWLGPTEARIAKEKAGILKTRVPIITGATGVAADVIRAVARSLAAPMTVVTAQADAPYSRLLGSHQRQNAAVAHATIKVLRRQGWTIPSSAETRGFANVRWPGRYERFTLKAGENTITWLLDGAHNAPAAQALARTLRDNRLTRVSLLFGALKDKDYTAIATWIAPVARTVRTAPVNSPRTADPGVLARLNVWPTPARPFQTVRAALADIVAAAPRETVLVTGSLYLVGEVRTWLRKMGAKGT